MTAAHMYFFLFVQELKKRAEKSKDRIVKKIVDKRTKEKNEDGHMFTAQ